MKNRIPHRSRDNIPTGTSFTAYTTAPAGIPAVICICLLLFSVQPSLASGAVVFMYHHFGQSEYPSTNIRLQQFDAHLDHLAAAGYQVWPLARIIDHLQHQQPIPDRTVALTVDDAYLSVYQEAYPRLKKRGWPLTVFVSTDAIDQHHAAYMSWDQLREMQHYQVTLANHSSSHDHLIMQRHGEDVTAWRQRVIADIDKAQQRLQQELGQAPPRLFAYPYGEYSPALKQIVADLGYSAFGQQSGAIGSRSDLQYLPRFPMSEKFASLESFITKAASLPLAVTQQIPTDPLISSTNLQPVLTITLAASDARLDELACYVTAQGRASVRWLNLAQQQFSVQARAPLQGRRNRYNCTAPSGQTGRYYWFSWVWIQQEIDEE